MLFGIVVVNVGFIVELDLVVAFCNELVVVEFNADVVVTIVIFVVEALVVIEPF